MRKIIGIFATVLLALFILSSCNKSSEKDFADSKSTKINLKSLEPEVVIKGSGDMKDYVKVVVESLEKEKTCKYEIVSGLVEFYYQDQMVFSVNFGDGNCDGVAAVAWVKDDGSTHNKTVGVWDLFKKGDEINKDKCFELILPVAYSMPDGSDFVIEKKDDWNAFKTWFINNPDSEEKPVLQYPLQIKFMDGKTRTVANESEMLTYKKECK